MKAQYVFVLLAALCFLAYFLFNVLQVQSGNVVQSNIQKEQNQVFLDQSENQIDRRRRLSSSSKQNNTKSSNQKKSKERSKFQKRNQTREEPQERKLDKKELAEKKKQMKDDSRRKLNETGFKTITRHLNFQQNYCKLVEEFRRKNPLTIERNLGIPSVEDFAVLSDYQKSIPSMIFKKYNNLFSQYEKKAKKQGHIKSSTHKIDLDPQIAIFYPQGKPDSTFWKINQTYACKWQRTMKSHNYCGLSKKVLIKSNVNNYIEELKLKNQSSCFEGDSFYSPYYHLNNKQECQEWFNYLDSVQYNMSQIERKWIVKRSKHQGFIPHQLELSTLIELLNRYKNGSNCGSVQADYIIQKYIVNPKLVDGYKFDVRAYLYIANRHPLIALYHPGHIKIAQKKYKYESLNSERTYERSTISQKQISQGENELSFQDFQTKYRLYSQSIWQKMEQKLMQNLLHLMLMNKKQVVNEPNSTFAFYQVQFILDDQENFWFIDSSPGALRGGQKNNQEQVYSMFDEMIKIQLILLSEGKIDNFLDQSNWKVLYDETKKGTKTYANLFKAKCQI